MAKKSKNILKSSELVDRTKLYSIDEAIALVKETSFVKFDGFIQP